MVLAKVTLTMALALLSCKINKNRGPLEITPTFLIDITDFQILMNKKIAGINIAIILNHKILTTFGPHTANRILALHHMSQYGVK